MTTVEKVGRPTRILLQTTIQPQEDDWNIGRFSLLRDHLASLKDQDGQYLYAVTARNRVTPAGQDDPVLSKLDRADFDELWLFAVDVGDGLNDREAAAIEKSGGDNHRSSRVVSESTFHHFVDYNWDLDRGCPSFLGEKPGHGIKDDPAKLSDIKQYVQNIAAWLVPAS